MVRLLTSCSGFEEFERNIQSFKARDAIDEVEESKSRALRMAVVIFEM
jgi:hypothetical protein